jgi:tetratricopeptide (TPR) repeat protein
MIEQGLVYIHSAPPTRRFRGAGALVEGGYIATCRHVWQLATGSARADPSKPLEVEVEYPWSRDGGDTVRTPARLVDPCEAGANPAPDLVLLRPDKIPDAQVAILRPARFEKFEVGEGYAIAALVRDKKKPNVPRAVKVPGTIVDFEGGDGRREFTGSNPTAFWFDFGSSGSPVFMAGGEQLAGIVSLSEIGANEGQSVPREAFVVPATTIRAHLIRVMAAATARGQHLDVSKLQPVLDALGAQDVPLSDIPELLMKHIVAARARAAEQVPVSNEGADIDAAIRAARAKLGNLDTAGARSLLTARIAEEEEARRQRLVPLLEERAAVEKLGYDYESAKTTLKQLLALAPDSVWHWIDLGDLFVTTGPLSDAATAFRSASEAALRPRHERNLSVSYNRIGDVQVAQGDLAGALKSYRDGLTIADRLAASDPGNPGWQHDLSVSYNKIGDVQVEQGDLAGALKSYRDSLAIRERLAASDPGNAGWQHDLSLSHARFADVFKKHGEKAKALDELRRGRAILVVLTSLSPDNAVWKNDLTWFDGQIAELER